MDLETGNRLHARDIIGTDYERLVRPRMRLRMRVRTQMRRGDPRYCSSICRVVDHLCRSPKRIARSLEYASPRFSSRENAERCCQTKR